MDGKRMLHVGAGKVLVVAAALAVAAAGTTGCTKTVVGGLAHHLEPGLGTNFAITNHFNQTVVVQVRALRPEDNNKPFSDFTSDGDYTILPRQTVWLDDVNLAANTCTNRAMVAYAGTHIVARHPSPLCVNGKAQGGWTIATP